MKSGKRVQHVPDILDCLAQLSSDEVPTPPKLARAMLDILPEQVWSNPDYKWLDPCCKSGVFLREVAARLLVGLAEWEPNFEKRRDHIFRNMLYGTSITEMTGIISRRSLYYSRDASGEYSVVHFDADSGNLPFILTEHTFGEDDRCSICRAPAGLERGSMRENYAYAFIHGTYPTKEMNEMKFDVVVGNPPYQIDDGGHGTSATSVYHYFVERAIALNPRYVVMITPSRWFAGGKGLDAFRAKMLSDKRIRKIVDYPKLYDGFPGVKIRGGVSYFLWDRAYSGPCTIQTTWDGKPVGPPVARPLDAYDVLIRRNEAVSILEKVRAHGERSLSSRVSSRKPFGFPTNFHGNSSVQELSSPVKLYGSQRISWVDRAQITQNTPWVDDWKVLMAVGTSQRPERHARQGADQGQ